MQTWREFYTTAPARAIALEELEEAALLRLRVLRVLSAAPSSDRLFCSHQDLPAEAWEAVELLDADSDLDCVAHFSLRLACCTDVDRLEWLVHSEARLMSLRVRSETSSDVLEMLRSLGREYKVYSTEHVARMVSDVQLRWLQNNVDRGPAHYCLVPFAEVSRFVGRRQVLLYHGMCLLPIGQMYYVLVHHYKVLLRRQLVALHRSLPAKRQAMDQLQGVIVRICADSTRMHSLPRSFTSRQRDQPAITLDNIDQVADKHFPLCMRQLHRKMRENHHLKYDGRVQYRVFLKGLGFSVHDNLLFFRTEFTKVIPAAKFDREYAYHIRHSYGLEGSRKDYAPMVCQKIIQGGAPRHGQFHGCPFKHWDSTTLHSEMRKMGVSVSQAESIARAASEGNHEDACAALFKTLHGQSFQALTDEESRQMHPNQWVFASLHAQP